MNVNLHVIGVGLINANPTKHGGLKKLKKTLDGVNTNEIKKYRRTNENEQARGL